MDYLIMAGQLMLSLSILIVLHEFGHYLPAKWFKIRAEKFYLFFDPYISLIKAKKLNGSWQVKTALSKDQDFTEDNPDQTEWGIGWLPLGGYVKIAGMIDESFDKEQMEGPAQDWEFRSKPAWQRLIVMLGGVTVNFVLGFLLLGMVLWNWGEQYLPAENVVYGIHVDSIGLEMGLMEGDKILMIGDKPMVQFGKKELIEGVVLGDATSITVERAGTPKTIDIEEKWISFLASNEGKQYAIYGERFPVVIDTFEAGGNVELSGFQQGDKLVSINGKSTPWFKDFSKELGAQAGSEATIGVIRNGQEIAPIKSKVNEKGQIGFVPRLLETANIRYGLTEAMPLGFVRGYEFLASQINAFGKMFSGKIKATEGLGGFGTFAKIFGSTWEWSRFWQMTAIISLILAFMNLLPIPALDGGHVMFLLYEMVSGRKPSDKFLEYATMAGFILVLGLVIFANGLDIMRGCS